MIGKKKTYEAIEKAAAQIIALGEAIYRQPETGFKEQRTARRVSVAFAPFPLIRQICPDFPGLKLTLDTKRPGPGIALVSELDAVVCPGHPDADPLTGAVHACGHNVQVAAMYGAALGLLTTGITDQLCGKIHFMALPAEEFIEIAERKQLIAEGRLSILGGKAELVQRGWFDDVDLCLMVHVMPAGPVKVAFQSFNGCLVKSVRFSGKAAHAGASPQEGINALYAAHTALAAMNGIRETFKDNDCVRLHPIITRGGSVVNVIPDDVRLETFVRGRNLEAINAAAFRFDRAMAGGALALGATVEIEDLPGAFPFINDAGLTRVAQSVLADLVKPQETADIGHTTGSTDAGDLTTFLPVIQPLIGCITGGLHEASYRVIDQHLAYIVTAQLLAGTAAELLAGQAAVARQIIMAYKPLYRSKNDFLLALRGQFRTREFPGPDVGGWPFCEN